MLDKIGLHRISNPSKERGAVSLHLYTPPYKMCKTFEENTGRARSSGICSFYSIGGNRIQADNK
jgi:cysteine dioxygenase